MKMLWITGVALLLDQVSKWLVMEQMVLGESVSVLGSVFKLTYIHNPGAVFGLRLGGPYAHLALAGGALVLVGVLLWQLPRGERLGAVGLTLVLGGAIGNMIDRVRFGVVVDFFAFRTASASDSSSPELTLDTLDTLDTLETLLTLESLSDSDDSGAY